MTDNINVYMDNILEMYADLMNVVVNPNAEPEQVKVDLTNHYDNLILILNSIDNEFSSNVGVSTDDIVTQKCRLCSNLNGIRTGVLRFVVCTKTQPTDTLKMKYQKKLLSDTILLFESTIADKISKYVSSVWFDK